jgi:hypothetical protein
MYEGSRSAVAARSPYADTNRRAGRADTQEPFPAGRRRRRLSVPAWEQHRKWLASITVTFIRVDA